MLKNRCLILIAILALVIIPVKLGLCQKTVAFPTIKNQVINNPAVQRGQLSWSFRDIKSGQELDAHQSKVLLTPASTLKLFTTALALDTYGIEHRFSTKIGIIGRKKKSSIQGDLVIRGDGDPSLGSGLAGSLTGDSVLLRIAKMLVDSGIKKITGDIVIDASKFPVNQSVIPRNWIWEDIGNYYGTGAWGLNWRANEFTVKFSPGGSLEDSSLAQITSPWAQYLQLFNSVKTTQDEKREVYIYSAPFSTQIFAEGKVIKGTESFTERAALPNPPLALGLEVKLILQKFDIEFDGEIHIENTRNLPFSIWQSIESPSMDELVFETNQHSNNLFAECLGKHLSLNNYSDEANPAGSYLEAQLNAYNPEADFGLQIVDASGLSRNNLVCTSFLSRFLRHKTKMIRFPYFLKSIPLAGEEGTMKSFPKFGQLRAKSGSMDGVRSYAGYFFDANNHWISFSMIANNIPLSQKETKILMAELIESAANYTFELPFKYAEPSTIRDTLFQLSEIVKLKANLERDALAFFESDEVPNARIDVRYMGEPSSENPYFTAIVSAGGRKSEIKYTYRFHAQIRQIERWNSSSQTWEIDNTPLKKVERKKEIQY